MPRLGGDQADQRARAAQRRQPRRRELVRHARQRVAAADRLQRQDERRPARRSRRRARGSGVQRGSDAAAAAARRTGPRRGAGWPRPRRPARSAPPPPPRRRGPPGRAARTGRCACASTAGRSPRRRSRWPVPGPATAPATVPRSRGASTSATYCPVTTAASAANTVRSTTATAAATRPARGPNAWCTRDEVPPGMSSAQLSMSMARANQPITAVAEHGPQRGGPEHGRGHARHEEEAGARAARWRGPPPSTPTRTTAPPAWTGPRGPDAACEGEASAASVTSCAGLQTRLSPLG